MDVDAGDLTWLHDRVAGGMGVIRRVDILFYGEGNECATGQVWGLDDGNTASDVYERDREGPAALCDEALEADDRRLPVGGRIEDKLILYTP